MCIITELGPKYDPLLVAKFNMMCHFWHYRKEYGCGISEQQQSMESVHHHILRGKAPPNLVWVNGIEF